MKKNIAFLIFSLIFLNSCITIYEEINVNSDGSGKVKLKIDLGKIGSNLNNQTSGIDMSFITKIKQFPVSASNILKSCKGISNINPETDDKKGVYSLSFDFKNGSDLNKAVYMFFGHKKKFYEPSFIKISGSYLKKKNIAPILKKVVSQQQKENKGFTDLMFPFISLKSTYRLPSEVKKVSNIKAVTDLNKKTVTTEFTLEELIKTKFDFGIRIKY